MSNDNNTQSAQAKVLEKIQHLLKKTTANGCTEDEAMAAASKVQELLGKYNLDLASVKDGNQQATASPEPRAKTNTGIKAGTEYQKRIFETLANNNFCWAFTSDGNHWLIGRELNVRVTMDTYQAITKAMKRLRPAGYTAQQSRLWSEGCTERLVDRLNEQRYEAEMASQKVADGDQYAVTLTSVYGSESELNQDAMYGREPGTTAMRNRAYRAQQAQREAERKVYNERALALVANGMSKEAAWYVARGREVPEPPKPMSEEELKEQAKREKARERRWARDEARWEQQRAAERRRQADPAYQAGLAAAERISLNVERTTISA